MILSSCRQQHSEVQEQKNDDGGGPGAVKAMNMTSRYYEPFLCSVAMFRRCYSKDVIKDTSKTIEKVELVYFHSFIIHSSFRRSNQRNVLLFVCFSIVHSSKSECLCSVAFLFFESLELIHSSNQSIYIDSFL